MRQSRRTARLFVQTSARGDRLTLSRDDAHYLAHVLRLRIGDNVTAFDGKGEEWLTTIERLDRRHSVLKLIEPVAPLAESPLELTLVQAVVKAEAMDSIVQKATELGVRRIRPALTEFSVVRLDPDRRARRVEHWQRIARSACEQSGRHTPPEIHAPASLEACLAAVADCDVAIVLDPTAAVAPALPARATCVAVVVGPEGGFGPTDVALIEATGYERLRLGGRVLRADTAAVAICTLVQQRWGDLG